MIGSHHLLKEAFCRRNVDFSRKHKLYRIASKLHSAIEIFTARSYLDERLVHSIGSASQFQMCADSLVNLGHIPLYQSVDS